MVAAVGDHQTGWHGQDGDQVVQEKVGMAVHDKLEKTWGMIDRLEGYLSPILLEPIQTAQMVWEEMKRCALYADCHKVQIATRYMIVDCCKLYAK